MASSRNAIISVDLDWRSHSSQVLQKPMPTGIWLSGDVYWGGMEPLEGIGGRGHRGLGRVFKPRKGEAFGHKTLVSPMTYRPNASPLHLILDFEDTP